MAEFKSFNGFEVKDEVARSISKGRNQAISYIDYEEMINKLNAMENTQLKTGQNIYIGKVGVPDLWVYSVEPIKNEFTYVSDEEIVELLNTNLTIQAGFYKVSMLEVQKVDLTNINETIADHDARFAKLNSGLESIHNGTVMSLTIENADKETYVELFTAPKTGFYFITAIAQWRNVSNHVATNAFVNSRIHIEKLGKGGGQLTPMSSVNWSRAYHQLYENVFLEKNEVVKLALRQTTGVDLGIDYNYRYYCIPIENELTNL